MKSKILIITFFSVSLSLFSQDNSDNNNNKENKDNEKIAYSNITEFGIAAASFKGIALEATTVHGISINKQHQIGLGIGMGYNFNLDYSTGYTPIFANYRYNFFPEKKRSPHINLSLGGVAIQDGGGIYSSLTMGYRVGKFSFSSGVTFMAICYEDWERNYFDDGNYWGYWSAYKKNSWTYPIGFTIKVGFSF